MLLVVSLRKKFFTKEEILHNEGCETLERVAQRGSGGPIPGNIQEQVGQGSE